MLGLTEDDWEDMGKNVKSNWDKTTSDFSNGNILSGIGDAKKFINNPAANNYPTTSPTLSDEHLGEPDENGFQKINAAGLEHLQNNTPDMSQPNGSGKGLIGRMVGSYTGGIL